MQLDCEPTISCGTLLNVRSVVGNFVSLWSDIFPGLSLDDASYLPKQVPLGLAVSLLQRAVQTEDDPALFIQHWPFLHTMGITELACQTSPTLRDAFAVYGGHASRFCNYARSQLAVVGNSVHLVRVLEPMLPDVYRSPYMAHLNLSHLHSIIRGSIDGPFALQGICFRGPQPSDRVTARLHQVFGVHAYFGADHDAMIFARRFLDAPLKLANPVLHDAAIRQLRTHSPCEGEKARPWVARAQFEIRLALAQARNLSLGELADRLGCHPRTLQLQMQREGTSYRDTVESIRRDMARHYLVNSSLPVRKISDRLGFNSSSAFGVACRAWYGKAPREMRDALRSV